MDDWTYCVVQPGGTGLAPRVVMTGYSPEECEMFLAHQPEGETFVVCAVETKVTFERTEG